MHFLDTKFSRIVHDQESNTNYTIILVKYEKKFKNTYRSSKML